MEKIAGKLVEYIKRNTQCENDYLEIYQYGIHIGMEMAIYIIVVSCISTYIQMFVECIMFLIVFILTRIYAGGLHLKNYRSCFICSIVVQTSVLLFVKSFQFTLQLSWGILWICFIGILIIAPVDSKNKRLDKAEIKHCRQALVKIISIIVLITLIFTILGEVQYVSLITITIFVVLVSAGIADIENYIVSKRVGN